MNKKVDNKEANEIVSYVPHSFFHNGGSSSLSLMLSVHLLTYFRPTSDPFQLYTPVINPEGIQLRVPTTPQETSSETESSQCLVYQPGPDL